MKGELGRCFASWGVSRLTPLWKADGGRVADEGEVTGEAGEAGESGLILAGAGRSCALVDGHAKAVS